MSLIPEIKKDQSIELLKKLHILTRDGKINQDSRRKLKQVYHLYHFIEPMLNKLSHNLERDFTIIDHGAGKSYLGFILYDLYLKNTEHGQIHGIETRKELVEKSKKIAKELQFSRMDFHALSVQESIHAPSLPKTIDFVTALHACDTATDDAITFGLIHHAKYILVVPCCQAEISKILKRNKGKNISRTALTEIYRHPLHTREFGAHLTNVLRCLWLESHGYQVSVTELTGWEHSLKNELIIAEYKDLPRNYPRSRLTKILHEFNLEELDEKFKDYHTQNVIKEESLKKE